MQEKKKTQPPHNILPIFYTKIPYVRLSVQFLFIHFKNYYTVSTSNYKLLERQVDVADFISVKISLTNQTLILTDINQRHFV